MNPDLLDPQVGGAFAVDINPERARSPTRWIRVLTTLSPSVVSWGEIEVIGAPVDSLEDRENLALGRVASALSHVTSQSPNLAIDGQTVSMWNAGTSSPTWIQVDLGRPCLIEEVRLFVAQDVEGETVHEIQFGAQAEDIETVHAFSEVTRHGQWLTYTIDHDRAPGGAEMGGGEGGHSMGVGVAGVEAAGGEPAGGEPEGGAPAGGEAAGGSITPPPDGPTVGKWRRIVLSFTDDSYEGNPFLIEMEATFTHVVSGLQLTLPAYYDGDNTWRVAFMPTELGGWTWVTSSADPDLDAHSGELTALNSDHRGLLTADPNAPNKWRYLDGAPVVPIGLFVNGMLDDASPAEFARLSAFLEEHHFTLINFRLSENDLAFSDVGALTMDLALWRRLEERLESLTDHGVGADIMLYTDDSGRPSFGAQSPAEQLLIRYMVARLSSFPSLLFNTGIDLAEYRDQAWVDWYGARVRALDPYHHPISSRYGGGSGQLIMAEQTFNSIGARNSGMGDLLSAYRRDDQLPALNNDNWSEDLEGLNGHTPADIRRAAWKAVVAGGVGFSVRHNTLHCPRGITECDRYFPIAQAIDLLDSESWLGHVGPFIAETLGEPYQSMHPAPELVDPQGGKFALADDRRTQLLFLLMGVGDTWDGGDGGAVTLRLGGVTGRLMGSWFDPRTGTLSPAGSFDGDQEHRIAPPSAEDWLLWLRSP